MKLLTIRNGVYNNQSFGRQELWLSGKLFAFVSNYCPAEMARCAWMKIWKEVFGLRGKRVA